MQHLKVQNNSFAAKVEMLPLLANIFLYIGVFIHSNQMIKTQIILQSFYRFSISKKLYHFMKYDKSYWEIKVPINFNSKRN